MRLGRAQEVRREAERSVGDYVEGPYDHPERTAGSAIGGALFTPEESKEFNKRNVLWKDPLGGAQGWGGDRRAARSQKVQPGPPPVLDCGTPFGRPGHLNGTLYSRDTLHRGARRERGGGRGGRLDCGS